MLNSNKLHVLELSIKNSTLHITMEEDDLSSLIEKTLLAASIDEEKAEWKANNVKARKRIIYSVRDHLVPHISYPEDNL
jgi:hypothetical protein